MTQMLKIHKNRKIGRYSKAIQLKRIMWGLCYPFFRLSLRPMFGWRRFLLILFGAKIGKHVHIYNTARIYFPWNLEIGDWSAIGEHALVYNLGKVKIGKDVTISQRVHLCAGTHDHNDPLMPLLTQPIEICDSAWIAADAFVGPCVIVGQGAVVGARAVVVRNISPLEISAGNPARKIGDRQLRKE